LSGSSLVIDTVAATAVIAAGTWPQILALLPNS
jgi:hypothetical protein